MAFYLHLKPNDLEAAPSSRSLCSRRITKEYDLQLLVIFMVCSLRSNWRQYKCHPKGNLYGFGLIASRYEADITKKIEYQGIGFANRLDYIAPLFSMSTALSERWLLGMSFGKDGSQSVRLHYRFARLPVDRDLSAVGCVRKKSPHTADCRLTVSPLYRPS